MSDFTIGGLGSLLNTGTDLPRVTATVAPFGQVRQILLDPTAECWRPTPDAALIWTRPQGVIDSFGRLVGGERVDPDHLLAEVDKFASLLKAAAQRVGTLFVPTWSWPYYDRGLGLLSMDRMVGRTYQLMRMNMRLADATRDESKIHILDAGRWTALAGPAATNPKLWFLGKIAFGPEVFRHAAHDIRAALRALKGVVRKVLVVDLDGTLWGGVVGDLGWQNLRLGGHDPVGEAFASFQRALKALARHGVVLCICSKNTESVALEAIDRHPEMVLNREDFAGWRINWNDKAENLVELAAELNVGLDSMVFIDDNPAERARVRHALPEILVPEWPADKLLYEKALAELTCFDTVAVSEEDRLRSHMYRADRQRVTLRDSCQSIDAYLASLGLRVSVEILGPSNVKRATQLLNKTNQMNLSTRRMTEGELFDFAEAPDNRVYVFRVSDRFDDYGLTGIASLSVAGSTGVIRDFVLSCRVMGRGVEHAMLSTLLSRARCLSLTEVVAKHLATRRNGPCGAFFNESAGSQRGAEEGWYIWDPHQPHPVPPYIMMEGPASAGGQALPTRSV